MQNKLPLCRIVVVNGKAVENFVTLSITPGMKLVSVRVKMGKELCQVDLTTFEDISRMAALRNGDKQFGVVLNASNTHLVSKDFSQLGEGIVCKSQNQIRFIFDNIEGATMVFRALQRFLPPDVYSNSAKRPEVPEDEISKIKKSLKMNAPSNKPVQKVYGRRKTNDEKKDTMLNEESGNEKNQRAATKKKRSASVNSPHKRGKNEKSKRKTIAEEVPLRKQPVRAAVANAKKLNLDETAATIESQTSQQQGEENSEGCETHQPNQMAIDEVAANEVEPSQSRYYENSFLFSSQETCSIGNCTQYRRPLSQPQRPVEMMIQNSQHARPTSQATTEVMITDFEKPPLPSKTSMSRQTVDRPRTSSPILSISKHSDRPSIIMNMNRATNVDATPALSRTFRSPIPPATLNEFNSTYIEDIDKKL